METRSKVNSLPGILMTICWPSGEKVRLASRWSQRAADSCLLDGDCLVGFLFLCWTWLKFCRKPVCYKQNVPIIASSFVFMYIPIILNPHHKLSCRFKFTSMTCCRNDHDLFIGLQSYISKPCALASFSCTTLFMASMIHTTDVFLFDLGVGRVETTYLP